MGKILGNNLLLFIDTETDITTPGLNVTVPGNFRKFVCLQDNGFDLTVDQIDTTSKCSGYFKTSDPGEVGWTLSGSGDAETSPDSDSIGHNEALELARNRTKCWFGEYDIALSTIRYGVGYFTGYSDASPRNASVTVTLAIQGDGELFDQSATT